MEDIDFNENNHRGGINQLLAKYICSISDVEKQEEFLLSHLDRIALLLKWMLKIVADDKNDSIYVGCLNCLLQISPVIADNEKLVQCVLDDANFLYFLNQKIVSNSATKDHFVFLVNISRNPKIIEEIANNVVPRLNQLIVKLIKQLQTNSIESELNLLICYYLINLSQSHAIREILVNDNQLIQLLNLFEQFSNVQLKKSLISIVRNCCFDTSLLPSLLTENDHNILIKLIYPLAGSEDFPSDEMSQLPVDLQYLPTDKAREPDPQIRQLLIEAIFLLCSVRKTRTIVRDSSIYYLLREYHQWETVPEVSQTIHNLIDVLIKKEAEIAADNLLEVDIPQEFIEKFKKFDLELLDELKQQTSIEEIQN